MARITLSPAQLLSLSTAFHAASTEDITPSITAIRLYRDGSDIVAIATDRYRVARIRLALHDAADEDLQSPDFDVLVHAKTFEATARAAVKGSSIRDRVRVFSVSLELENDTFTIVSEFGSMRATVRTIKGMFPPVERLIPGAELLVGDCSPVSLKPAFLATIAKLTIPELDTRNAAWLMERQADEGNKPKPVLFSFENEHGRAEYMIQPNLRLR